jgi:hypothetical protein
MAIKNPYEYWRFMGADKVTAARMHRQETVEELEERDFDVPSDEQVRAAVVRSRKSLILIGHELDEIAALARSLRRWLIVVTVVLIVILLTRL